MPLPSTAPAQRPSPPQAASAIDESEAYDAFARRDAGRRGDFVMGVRTTGVYCRPGCPARAPLRRNVRFFPTVEAARSEGFRPCLRCRPDSVETETESRLAKACRRLEAAEAPVPLAALALEAGLSPHHFHRLFTARLGVTPAAYGRFVRDRRAKAALDQGASVTEAVYEGGFGSASRFYADAADRFGMAPKRWRDQGRSETIDFAIADCRLGKLLVAATERGLCAVEFGEDGPALEAALRARFARAEIRRADEAMQATARRVAALADGAGPVDGNGGLPLDVRGTAFQLRVWEALRAIPRGETRTYGEIARHVDAPGAARAVGAACAANPLALLTPCHRVVGGADAAAGRVGRYRWGEARKRALIEAERRDPPRR